MLTAGAAAEVRAGYNDVTLLHCGGKLRVNVLHAVGGQGSRRGIVHVTGGNDDIGVHIGTVFIYFHTVQILSFDGSSDKTCYILRGSATHPATAEAAATSGLARMTSEDT